MLKKINWRYALGELLIVIAGITIAFALNNWAQNRADNRLENKYLQNIKTDIEADMAELDSNIHQLESTGKLLQTYIPHLYRELPGRDTVPVRIFQNIHKYVYFFPHKATYESMLHSGDLKLIRNFELKNQIVEHYNSYTRLFKEIERHEHFAKSYTADYFMKETDHEKLFSSGQPELLSDPYLKNLLFSSYGIFNIQVQAHRKARQDCEALLEMINRELDG